MGMPTEELISMREEMDSLNNEMLAVFLRRLALSSRIIELKDRLGMPPHDPTRESAIIAEMCEAAGEAHAPYTARFFENLLEVSRLYAAGIVQKR